MWKTLKLAVTACEKPSPFGLFKLPGSSSAVAVIISASLNTLKGRAVLIRDIVAGETVVSCRVASSVTVASPSHVKGSSPA